MATATIEAGSALAEDLDRRFKADRELDCVVVVEAGIPTHLVTREHYYAKTGGPYGFTFYQKKPAEAVAKPDPLVVTEDVHVLSLARLALSRPRENQYDPLIVTDPAGRCRGIVTIRQLILKNAELEVQTAQLSNPLTHLPGTALALFQPGDLARGFFHARDDRGNLVKVPLLTLSLAVVASRTLGTERHPAVFSQAAASLRRTAKTLTAALGRSGFVVHGWRDTEALA